jgi:hypothetical protein
MKPYLLITLLMLTGCAESSESTYQRYNIKEITVDSCEYLYNNAGKFLTHKGNCNNEIHKQN